MSGQTFTRDGVIYRDNGDGTATAVAYDEAPIGGQTPQYQVQSQTVQPQVQQAQAQAQDASVDASVNAATRDAQVRTANANAAQAEAEAQRAMRELQGGNVSPERRAELTDRVSRLNQVVAQINRVQELFDQSVGATRGVGGVLDYLPSDANSRFDAAGASLSQQGLAAFRVPGTGTISDRDAIMFDRANLPTASTRDSAIDEQLTGLRSRVAEEMRALGLDPPDFRETTLERFQPSAMDQTFINTGPAATQTGSGQTSDPIPPEMQQEYQAWVLGNVANMTPENYTAFRQQLDRKYGFESGDYAGEGERIIDGFRNGGTLNLTIPPVNRDMTELETSADARVRNPVGAFAANAANMIGAGGAEAFAGGKGFAALRNEFPVSSTLGEIAGAMGGTTLLGRAGAAAISRTAPRLLGGGGRAQFGRNLATDIAYSGAYGVNTGQGVAGTAAEGGVGSVAGQLLGRGVGRAVSGVNVSPAVDYLRSRNIPLTTGQTLGDFASRLEQRAASLPLVSDMIRARRIDGEEGLNRAALSDAGAPIGFTPTRIGREGVADLMGDRAAGTGGAVNDAYDNAVAGQSFGLDPQLIGDVDAAAMRAERLPPDLRTNANRALQNTFEPLANNTAITGPQWQGMRRDLAGYRAEQTGPGFPEDYRNVMDQGVDALNELATRQGGPEIVDNLNNANRAYRLGNIVQDAASRADGADYRFTASQLQDANKASGRRFPGQNPLVELADNAQQVMGQSVPNSGTADRLMQAGVFTGMAGLGGSIGLAAGGDAQSAGQGAAIPTAAMILAALGGTRSGQRAINAMLTQRPASARALGDAVRRNSGLFGSAAIPLVLTN